MHDRRQRRRAGRVFQAWSTTTMIKVLALLALLALPSSLAFKTPQQQLVDLAAANNGHITLDEATYDMLTSNKRTWSVAIQFTAQNPQRRCVPCKYVIRRPIF